MHFVSHLQILKLTEHQSAQSKIKIRKYVVMFSMQKLSIRFRLWTVLSFKKLSKSFKYNENRKDDTFSHCLTPTSQAIKSENSFLWVIHDLILLYTFLIILKHFPSIQLLSNFAKDQLSKQCQMPCWNHQNNKNVFFHSQGMMKLNYAVWKCYHK